MEKKKTIPKRSEVDKQYTWAMEDMFATDELWFEALEDAKAVPAKILSYKGKLNDAKVLFEYLQYIDKVSKDFGRLLNYVFRKSDEDTANSKYTDMRGKGMTLYVEVGSASAFEVPELMQLSDADIDRFMKEVPELKLYERRLNKTRRMKAHVLSEAEETLLAASADIASAADDIGSVFRNADLRFPDVVDKNGEAHQLTQGSYIPIMQGSDRDLRCKTFETFYGVFESFKNTTAAFLDAQVKQLRFYAKARKYDNTLEASLFDTEVPEKVYHNLIATVNENLPLLHKYVRLRKKLMGVSELHMYDLYSPIVSDADREISYEEAKLNVIEGLKPLGSDYINALKEGFNNRWIDVYENEGKRGGAYSSCGDPHPYVLLNHKDTLDCEFTLAHEMGHALHTYHTIKNQPQVYADYVIFVAEVASTCNEVLLMKHLLSKTTEKSERAYLINYFLEQYRNTLYRQTMFAEFELEMNRMSERGDSLTADALSNLYYELNCKYYGDDIVVDKAIQYEWSRIPHFFYNFYVFQYSTGFSAAVALANRILTEGQPAVDDYIKFLSSGWSQDPISLLKIAGVDMETSKPISDALKLFGELIDEMDALMS